MAQVATEFVLIQDQDCHWYVCPADKQDEASAYFEAAERYWNDPRPGEECPAMPNCLVEVGGAPSLVQFTGYTIK